MAITSSVRMTEKVRLRKVRKLSVPGEVLVREGQTVGPDTVIAKTDLVPGGPRVVDITAELGERFTPEEMDKILVKKVGDKVRSKDILATYQKNFWAEAKAAYSPCDGTVEYISKTQRRIIIREDPRSAKPMSIVSVASKLQIWPWTIRMFSNVREGDQVHAGQVLASAMNVGSMDYVYSPMAGVVDKICPKSGTITIVRPVRPSQVKAHLPGVITRIVPEEGGVVEATGAYLEGVFGLGGERFGEIVVASDGPGGHLGDAGVCVSHKGKVLVAGGSVSLEAMRKARMIGVQGMVVGGANNADLVQFLGKEISVGITGQEDIEVTIIIMEGFGAMPMNERTWELLMSRAGRTASLDGTTHIRAGAVRPQILISTGTLEEDSEAMPIPLEGEDREGLPFVTNLVAGDRVRCVREPYLGQWGVVEDLPASAEMVESEAYMEVAMVRLDGGRLVKVSEANLEVFRDSAAAVS